MDIKSIKARGKIAFKANYWRSVLVAFILSLLLDSAGVASRNAQNNGDTQGAQELSSALDALPEDKKLAVAGIALGTVALIAIVAFLLRIFLFNPLQVGGYRFFRRNAEGERPLVGVLGEGFGGYGRTFVTLLLRDIFLLLWTLLLLIPGIVKSYSYMLVPYLIKDRPELSATETITLSRELMNGHKKEAFILDLSFLGWFLLGAVTLGIFNIFYTDPYHENARARFYLDLLGE